MKLYLCILSSFAVIFAANTWAEEVENLPPTQTSCDYTIPGPSGDDTQTIVSALSNPNHTRVCLDPGTYELSETLILDVNKKLLGNGGYKDESNNVVLSTTESFSDDSLIVIRNGSKIENLVVKPRPLSQPLYSFPESSLELKRNFVRYGIRAGFGVSEKAQPATGSIISKIIIRNVENPITIENSEGVKVNQVAMFDNGSHDDCQGDVAVYFRNSDNFTLTNSGVFLTPEHRGKIAGVCNVDPDRPGKGALDGDGSVACHFSNGFRAANNTHIATGTGSYYLNYCSEAVMNNLEILDSQGWAIDGGPGGNCNLVVKNTTVRRSGRGASVLLVDDELLTSHLDGNGNIIDYSCSPENPTFYNAHFTNNDFRKNMNDFTRDYDGNGHADYDVKAECEGVNHNTEVSITGDLSPTFNVNSDVCLITSP